MLVCAVRIAVGAGLLFSPKRAAHGWIGTDIERPVSKMLVRSVGIRDLILGTGGMVALTRGQSAAAWVRAGGTADAVDSVLTTMSFRHLPSFGRFLTLAVTLFGAVTSFRLASRVDADEMQTADDGVLI